MNTHELSCRIKSARRKKRLVNTNRDKKLIQLKKRREELSQQKHLLPMILLEQPYQRGWKRFFVLQDEVKRSSRADFYQTLLNKINTVEYNKNKSFKRKKRRKERCIYKENQQLLRQFSAYSWDANQRGLTEEEKARFNRVETLDVKTRRTDIKYVFSQPWIYKLKITPHIITHTKQVDGNIETELAYIHNHLTGQNLWARITKLNGGKGGRYRDFERFKYINKIKNIPRYNSTEGYLDLET